MRRLTLHRFVSNFKFTLFAAVSLPDLKNLSENRQVHSTFNVRTFENDF